MKGRPLWRCRSSEEVTGFESAGATSLPRGGLLDSGGGHWWPGGRNLGDHPSPTANEATRRPCYQSLCAVEVGLSARRMTVQEPRAGVGRNLPRGMPDRPVCRGPRPASGRVQVAGHLDSREGPLVRHGIHRLRLGGHRRMPGRPAGCRRAGHHARTSRPLPRQDPQGRHSHRVSRRHRRHLRRRRCPGWNRPAIRPTLSSPPPAPA